MAQIALTTIGQTVGSALLPNGIGAFGVGISGAAIGGAIGGLAGRAIDGALFGQTREGPRIESIPIMESREGAGVPNIYGRMRVGGQVIWAARLNEIRETERAGGGKGGPRVANYRYTASFAVALCEGPINRVARVWANGEIVALSDFQHRLYTGTEVQEPDPLIEAIEGTGSVPAYRGTAYIVFEDLPLEAFGKRLPQLSFEVIREAPARSGSVALSTLIDGVNIIPASGEFVYGTEPVRQHYFPATEFPENTHSPSGRADMLESLDQLEMDLPSVRRTALTIGWFGNDLRAGHCQIRPGIETEDKQTRPYDWCVGGTERQDAYLISRADGGGPNYGGTPADRAVIEGIRELNARGMDVTISPFLFMDIPPTNGLPDPHGGVEQAAFPWRGRIVASDGTAAARSEIAAFLGNAQINDFEVDGDDLRWVGDEDDWGFRRFILHQAYLSQIAGSVESFLLGSEMVGLTRIRDDVGRFPFVDGLIALVSDVRAILGPAVKISYAADWTEYGAYVPGDGSNDVLFPLDDLWANGDVDFVGVDWYPPAGDWREGDNHLDALAGFSGPEDPAYLLSQFAGGEAYDWFYASADDRDAQIRTPIIDTAHGEHWVFRQKDLIGWWQAGHHERPGGVRRPTTTPWQASSKPIRLSEIGFPAVDKGGNSPNLFYDPKSSESAVPPYSNGERDDLFQRAALTAAMAFWQQQPAVEATYVWAWDARPWPIFPLREDIWSDGPNWRFGHWLNGRAGLSELGRVIEDIGARGGIDIDASGVTGVIDGYALTGVSSVRDALTPIFSAHDLIMIERDGELVVAHARQGPTHNLAADAVGEGGVQRTRSLLDKPPGALRLTYIDGDGAYEPASVQVFAKDGDRGMVLDLGMPIAMTESRALQLARRFLDRAAEPEDATMSIDLRGSDLEAGDRVVLDGVPGEWRIEDLHDRGAIDVRLKRDVGSPPSAQNFVNAPATDGMVQPTAKPELIVIDGPQLPGRSLAIGPLLAAFGTPWSRPVSVLAGPSADLLSVRARVADPAGVGQLVSPLTKGPTDRWDRNGVLHIQMPGQSLDSYSDLAVLNGAGLILVEGADASWELLAYRDAELVAAGEYRLSTLLRGLRDTPVSAVSAGARCLLADSRLQQIVLDEEEVDLDLIWRAEGRGGLGDPTSFLFQNLANLPYAPAHIERVVSASTDEIRWVRRGSDIGDGWRDIAWPNSGVFEVCLKRDGVAIRVDQVSHPVWPIVSDARSGDVVEVREIGADGRPGRLTSITL